MFTPCRLMTRKNSKKYLVPRGLKQETIICMCAFVFCAGKEFSVSFKLYCHVPDKSYALLLICSFSDHKSKNRFSVTRPVSKGFGFFLSVFRSQRCASKGVIRCTASALYLENASESAESRVSSFLPRNTGVAISQLTPSRAGRTGNSAM